MKFKQLEVEQEGGWLKRTFRSKQLTKTLIYIVPGGVGGFLYFYFTEGQQLNEIIAGAIIKSVLIGGFFGFFITNSPCARGRC